MSRRRLVYEGKAKILYAGPEPGTLVQYFKDDATAFNAEKHAVIDGKGVLNNFISEYIMKHLASVGVPTHFVRRINMREQLIREAEIIPLEVVVRNVAAGSLSKRFGIEEGEALPRPIVEYYFKDDKLGDPLVAEEHIAAFNWCSQQDLDDMVSLALRINDFLSGLFLGIGVKLVDFKVEFGHVFENEIPRVILADEISPDSCRLWDIKSGEKFDKDVFRRDLGDLMEAYTEIANRLGVMPEKSSVRPTGPKLVH
jgi:phosphoribosylaminoimidazole-succinocarboxamide synthase